MSNERKTDSAEPVHANVKECQCVECEAARTGLSQQYIRTRRKEAGKPPTISTERDGW